MIKDKLIEDMKQALKEGNTIKKNTIQLLRAAILQEEKDKQIILDDNGCQQIIFKEKKKRIDALAQFEKANRPELVEQTNKELYIVQSYLPQPASEEEVIKVIQDIITRENATPRDTGKVIKLAKDELGLTAEGQTISFITKKLLEV